MNTKNFNLLIKFSRENEAYIASGHSKPIGKFTVEVKSKLLNKTFYDVPITVQDRNNYGVLVIEWDKYGLSEYRDLGLFEEHGTKYYMFTYKDGCLTLSNDDILISIE